MLKGISWSEYLVAAAVVAAVYYVCVGYLFFRKDITRLVSDKVRQTPLKTSAHTSSVAALGQSEQDEEEPEEN